MHFILVTFCLAVITLSEDCQLLRENPSDLNRLSSLKVNNTQPNNSFTHLIPLSNNNDNESKMKSIHLDTKSEKLRKAKEELILYLIRNPDATPLSRGLLSVHLTCNDLHDFQRSNSRLTMEYLMELIGMKDTDRPYNPEEEVINTEVCRIPAPTNQDPLPPTTSMINLQSVQVNFYFFMIIVFILILTEFSLANTGLKLMRQGKDVLDYSISRVFYSRLGPTGYQEAEQLLKNEKESDYWWQKMANWIFNHDFKEQCGEEESRLLNFQFGLIVILGAMTTMSLVDVTDGMEINVIGAALCLLFFFMLSSLVFYHQGNKGKIINGLSQQESNQFKTLLVSKIDPRHCNQVFLRSYFEDDGEDVVAGISLVRKVDDLERLDEELTIAQQTRDILATIPADQRQPITPKLFSQPVDPISFYDDNINKLTSALERELGQIESQSVTAAFVTFTTREKAMKAYKRHQTIQHHLFHPFGYAVDWAPPVSDIVWSTIHTQGHICHLVRMILLYLIRVFITLAGPSVVFALVRMSYSDNSFTVLQVLPYLRSFLTMAFWCIACCLDIVSHSRNSSAHIGLFFSSLVIQVVSEILLPMLLFKDIVDSFSWMAESPDKVDHWIRLLCFFRPTMGTEMAITIIKWSFLQNTFVVARIPQLFNSFRIGLTTSSRIEAKLTFQRKTVDFEIGTRYAELVAQFFITFIGVFTYPPIILVSFLCMLVRYFIDSYNACKTFSRTTTGINVHRWAIFCTMLAFVVQSGLLLYKLGVMENNRLETLPVWDSVFVTVAVGLFIIISLATLTFYFCLSSAQMHCESNGAVDESHHYIPPVLLKWNRVAQVPLHVSNDLFEDNNTNNKMVGLIRILKFLVAVGSAIFLLTCVLVAAFRFEYVPPISFRHVTDVQVKVDYKYNVSLYTGRIPYFKMVEQCSLSNPRHTKTGWLTIESKCEDILIDQAVRNNWLSVFGRTEPHKRLLWTGGFFNLSQDDDWHWIDPTATTDYQNFCHSNETMEIISKAKSVNQTILYIVKDYRATKLYHRGLSCWQIYHSQDLADLGMSYLLGDDPRLAFACKSFPGNWISSSVSFNDEEDDDDSIVVEAQ